MTQLGQQQNYTLTYTLDEMLFHAVLERNAVSVMWLQRHACISHEIESNLPIFKSTFEFMCCVQWRYVMRIRNCKCTTCSCMASRKINYFIISLNSRVGHALLALLQKCASQSATQIRGGRMHHTRWMHGWPVLATNWTSCFPTQSHWSWRRTALETTWSKAEGHTLPRPIN